MSAARVSNNRYLAVMMRREVWLPPAVIALGLLPIAGLDHLTFHTLVELVAVVIAFAIFAFGWYTYPLSRNNFLLILASGYCTIGAMDLFHTLVYPGMSMIIPGDANLAIGIWLVTRASEALLLLIAALAFRRSLQPGWLTLGFAALGLLLVLLVLWGPFPVTYVEGEGLTAFKVVSEYLIVMLFGLGGVMIYRIRHQLDEQEAALLVLAILLAMAAELTFTLYTSLQGAANLVGHVLKIYSHWAIFLAVVATALQKVYRDLLHSNEALLTVQHAQQQLALAVEQNPASIVITDVKGNIEYANPAFYKITGYEPQEVMGRNPRILSSHEKPLSEYREMWQQITAGEVWRGLFHNRRKDGSLYWEAASISPLISQQGDIINYVGIKEDVTERLRLEQEISQQKEVLEVIFDSMTDAFVFTDTERRIVAVNRGFVTMFGYRQEEILGNRTVTIYASQEEYERQGQLRFNLSAKDLALPYVVQYRRQDGSQFPGETIGRKVMDKAGKAMGFIGIIRDVTERARQEALKQHHELELRRERDLAQRYLDLSPAMLALIDQQGTIELINERGCQLLGYREEEILHHNWFDLVLAESARAEVKKVFGQIMAGQVAEVEHYENYLLVKGGEQRLFSFHNTAMEDDDGRIIGVLFSADDISERMQTERALRHAVKMEAVGQLTGGIAHDFNNILAIVMGNLELLQAALGKNEPAQQRLTLARKGVERGSAITRKLLDFSRGRSEHSRITDLNSTIEALHELITHSLTPKIDVQTRLSSHLWPVDIDEGEMEDVLLNLAINARDAMPGGGLLLVETSNCVLDESYQRLHPEASLGAHVLLSVSDNGSGIPEAIRERVFEPFFSTKNQNKGSGLGLSMVYGFVQRSGGHIRIYSEEGQGTSLRLYLPRAWSEPSLSASAENVESQPLPRGRETILIVDDEKLLLEITQETLAGLGYRTLVAANGEEALVQLREHPTIDLLFSDVIMPGGYDGYQLALAAMQQRPELKVLLTSGFTRNREIYVNGDRAQVEQLAERLLSKPYDRYQLACAIRQALDEHTA